MGGVGHPEELRLRRVVDRRVESSHDGDRLGGRVDGRPAAAGRTLRIGAVELLDAFCLTTHGLRTPDLERTGLERTLLRGVERPY